MKRLERPSRISVVVISLNEGEQLRRTVENLDDTLPGDAEIIVVDDSSTDGSARRLARRRGRVRVHRVERFGVARARNYGARQSRGDVIVFADAHIRLDPFWWRPLVELLRNPRVGGAAPAITGLRRTNLVGYGLTFTRPNLDIRWFRRKPKAPVPAPIIPGCCFAMRRDVFEATGGWDEGQMQCGNIDNEGCVRLWLLGYDLMITPETVVGHLFRKRFPYPVGWPQYVYNRLRLAFVNLNAKRLGKVVASLRTYPGFGEALNLLVDGDITARRREIISRQIRSDDWYFERFGIKW
jgi:glycosyltransferase involved in cell wall biosynthesis